MKAGRGNEIIEKNKSRRGVDNSKERRLVEYSAIGCKVTTMFIINVKMCKREGI